MVEEEKKLTDLEKELMLIEYKKAQDSAEHHDYMAWFTSAVLVVASVSLLGFLLSNVNDTPQIFILLGSVIGIFLIVIHGGLFYGAHEIKKEKYERCKEIEEKFNSFLKVGKEEYQISNHLLTKNLSHHAKDLYFLILLILVLGFIMLPFFLII